MNALNSTPRQRGPRVALLTLAICVVAAGAAASASAQQATNPGDIIVERTITPRNAFDSVPKSQDPVAVRATTFPANSFNPAIAQMVSDTDLTNAHGSSGVATGGVLAAGTGVQAVTQILSGKSTGNNIALNAGLGQPGPTGGIGNQISSTITGSLAPLTNALGSLGALK
ncbi:hypothetical protein [Paraburkholderia sp.]|uniref:hypothetical protein n=1 Tax=Paraburkholderia sp. TaxID=1926495 RepID=UPI0023990EE2|nr:hypothetical protein [Paraburkholderia sp.]MDE1183640.1 hypothetical protein [Paraburkholderia sp.]